MSPNSVPEQDANRLDAATDQAIAACDGDTLNVPSEDGLSFSRHQVNAVHHVPSERYERQPYAILYVSAT
jgi:hypothetical protein